MEEKVVKTKDIMYKGKKYTISLTESMLNDIRKQAEICKLNGWSFDDMLNNRVSNMIREDWPEVCASCYQDADPKLEVGVGATMVLYSDKRAMTIVEVISPKEIVVQENNTECINYYAGAYKVLDSINENMGKSVFTLRKNGTWVEKGQPKKFRSIVLVVGYRRHYIDPQF